jgi:sugar transferase EpsL
MYPSIKRALDLVGSIVTLVLLSPLMIAIAVILRITFGRPILFRQQRPGRYEKLFTCLKFRTMTNDRTAAGELLPDDQRTTRFGWLLRRTSLDELPQLLNILKGDLSFIGPRPLLKDYMEVYTKEERKRHNVRPGLSGWAQIHGRKTLTFEQRFAYDLYYVENVSFSLDALIVLRTIWMLLVQRSSAIIPDKREIPLDMLRSQRQSLSVHSAKKYE